MNPIYRQSFLIALATVLSIPAWAQQKSTVYQATFRGLAWDSMITDLNIADGTKVVPMTLFPNGRSQFYTYQGTDPMLFFREVTGTDGKLVAEVSGSIPLGEFKQRTLLIFFKKPANQYMVRAVDDSDAAIPPGSYCFLNLSNFPLQVKCGPGQGTVPANGTASLRGEPGGGASSILMQIDAVTPDGRIVPAYSNLLPFGKMDRTLVFVYQEPQSGAFVIKRVAEDATMIPRPTPVRRR
jgi:hypothetical protein